MTASVRTTYGDLLDQPVEVVVNAWNRNVFPAWLLVPHGVAGAIRKRAGYAPFREVRKYGVLALGAAVETGAGRLPYRAIIHVAGLHFAWHSSERAVRLSIRNAVETRTVPRVSVDRNAIDRGGYARTRRILQLHHGRTAQCGLRRRSDSGETGKVNCDVVDNRGVPLFSSTGR